TPIRPSAATRSAFLAAFDRPFLRSQSIACSMSPFTSVRAALQSIMPAPVLSRSAFTKLAVTSAIAVLIPLCARYRWVDPATARRLGRPRRQPGRPNKPMLGLAPLDPTYADKPNLGGLRLGQFLRRADPVVLHNPALELEGAIEGFGHLRVQVGDLP